MQLQQVECVSFQIPQTAIDKVTQVLAVISRRDVWLQPASGLGRNYYLFASFAFEPCQQTLTAPVAVDIGGIEEVDTQVHGPVQRRERIAVINVAPRAADGPGAKTNLGNLPAGSAQFSIFHDWLLSCPPL